MSSNPYQSPPAAEPQQAAPLSPKSSIAIPAAVLAILGAGASLIDIYFAFTLVVDTLNYVAYAESHGQQWEFGRQLFAGSMAIVAAFLCHLVVLVGAISMLCGARGRWARAAVVLALIPCLSPFIVAGIPFALWALVAMRRSEKGAARGSAT